jgi:hypothetical protein
MGIGVVVGAIMEELTEEISDADVFVDVETHHFVDKIFRSVICLLRDNEIVALEENGDGEVAAEVHIFGVTGESRDVSNVWAAGIGTRSNGLEEFDEKVRNVEIEEERLEVDKFRGVDEAGVSRGRGTGFEIADEVKTIDNKEKVRDKSGGRDLAVLFDVEGVVERGGVKTKGHEDWAEIALKINDCMVASRDGILIVYRHLGEESIGGSRSRSGSLRHFLLILELKALELGGDLEIKSTGRHVESCVESGIKKIS